MKFSSTPTHMLAEDAAKQGSSNKGVKGSHSGGKGGNKGDKHSNANTRRAQDQGVKGNDDTK